MIAAILRAQFLSMRMGARRGAVFGAIAATLWYGFWTLLALLTYGLAATADRAALDYALPLGFLLIFAYWQVIPVLSASMGSSLEMRKLLVYPVPHGKLFSIELLLRLAAGAEMIMLLAGGLAGLLSNHAAGGWAALPRLFAAVLLFILFNLLLGSGVRSVLERLLARRTVREVLVLVLLMLWMVPRLLMMNGALPKWLPAVGTALGAFGWPWSAAARAAAPPAGQSPWLPLGSLCCWTALAAWFGRMQFERTLRYDTAAAQATPANGSSRARGLVERFYRLPGLLWRDPLAGIVEKELRSLARTPRFRVVFIMGFTFGLLVWLPMVAGRHAPRAGGLSGYFLPIVCVYALTILGQVTYWNCFGFDRSAVQIYFAAPQPLSAALLGKNIACLIFIYVEVSIVIGITAALRMTAGWGHVLESLVVVAVCSLYMLALGNISSVQYPRPLSPERVSQGGASSRFQGLLFLVYPLALIPVFLAYLARYALGSRIAFAVVLALAAAIGGVFYWLAMESAVNTATTRREYLIQELSRGEGPVASN
jgi:ABC-2 type transport system permease protein